MSASAALWARGTTSLDNAEVKVFTDGRPWIFYQYRSLFGQKVLVRRLPDYRQDGWDSTELTEAELLQAFHLDLAYLYQGEAEDGGTYFVHWRSVFTRLLVGDSVSEVLAQLLLDVWEDRRRDTLFQVDLLELLDLAEVTVKEAPTLRPEWVPCDRGICCKEDGHTGRCGP